MSPINDVNFSLNAAQLLVRWSSMRVPGCAKGVDGAGPLGCYSVTDQAYDNAQGMYSIF